MARTQYPSDKQEQFVLRLPAGMREKLKIEAEKNNRSANSEMVARLTATLETKLDPEALDAEFAKLEELQSRLNSQFEDLQKLEEQLKKIRRSFSEEMQQERMELEEKYKDKWTDALEKLRVREERIEYKDKLLREEQQHRTAEIAKREKSLDDAIAQFAAREKQLSDLIQSLEKTADAIRYR